MTSHQTAPATPIDTHAASTRPPWTCPFCALLCDRFAAASSPGGGLTLQRSDCARAARALTQFSASPSSASATIDGKPSDLEHALDQAAELLAASTQPLFGGMATDIAGARALYRLANLCHAIVDHANGATLLPGLRTLQDRGVFQTTLAEIAERADVIVCLGTQPAANYPEFFRRCRIGTEARARTVIFVGCDVDPALSGATGLTVRSIPLQRDWFETLAALNVLCRQRPLRGASAELATLAQTLLAARYAAIVWEPATLPGTQTALLVEAINHLIKTLNRTTRAGGLALAGNDGALAVNQVFGWLSGLPLRTGVLASGLQHEPHRFETQRLLQDGAVDALLWVESFGPLAPPGAAVPTVVLGHPALASARTRVFIPVSTPGIGSRGHLFRVDGVVVVPLEPIYADTLPTVADVAERLGQRLSAQPARAA